MLNQEIDCTQRVGGIAGCEWQDPGVWLPRTAQVRVDGLDCLALVGIKPSSLETYRQIKEDAILLISYDLSKRNELHQVEAIAQILP